MDKRMMKLWVDKVLAPYLLTAPPHVQPLLLLDSYRCHMMASVINRIEELGCQVEHIPAGCTGMAQPVDVGVNKPFKNAIRERSERFLLTQICNRQPLKAPSRGTVATWIHQALDGLSPNIVCNAWTHGKFSYFPCVWLKYKKGGAL